jgi:hypothetical protein
VKFVYGTPDGGVGWGGGGEVMEKERKWFFYSLSMSKNKGTSFVWFLHGVKRTNVFCVGSVNGDLKHCHSNFFEQFFQLPTKNPSLSQQE